MLFKQYKRKYLYKMTSKDKVIILRIFRCKLFIDFRRRAFVVLFFG